MIDGSVELPGTRVTMEERKAQVLERKMIIVRDEDEWEDMQELEQALQRARAMEPIRDVLVFTPVYRLEPETVQAALGQEWDGAISHLFQRDNPGTDGRRNHLHQYRRGRETFLAGKWDAMLVIESDIIPPPNALKELAAIGADCTYGVYRFRVTNVINIYEKYPGQPRNIGESLSVRPHIYRRAVMQQVYPCSGAGLGCVLIRRRVLEKIDFRLEEAGHCDTFFNRDVLQAGFSQLAAMRVICGHKEEGGTVLWPEYRGKDLRLMAEMGKNVLPLQEIGRV